MKIWKALPLLLLAACAGKDIHIDRITLDPPSLILLSGSSEQLSVRFLSGKTENVLWFSDDESVASVQGGKVTAIAKGATLIFAKTENSGLLACCEVTVRNAADFVAGVELAPQELSIEVGDATQLTATVLPATAVNKSIEWSSSDISIATVGSDGIVYGMAEGVAVITVATVEGGFTASCNVTVKPKYYALESIGLPAEITVAVGETYLIEPQFVPENATNKAVTWFCYDESIATVDGSGLVTGIAPGGTHITVKSAEGGFTDITYVRVTEAAVE
ncbi:MAG: Ig-like domain-containing protein [Bacteroidales bacterium]|nr:Ig-like domain-containing protein [Bacteroidales bacterium]